MAPLKALGIYATVSCVMVFLPEPGQEAWVGIAWLLAGAVASLRMSIISAEDVWYTTGSLEYQFSGDWVMTNSTQFSSENLVVCIVALGLWLLGGLLIFLAAKKKWHGGNVLLLATIWVASSGYNLFHLAMMHL